jgi:N-acetylglutamate synthase-like GNAT family acetyltransferase
MIRALTINNLPEYAEVIRKSFATVAVDFEITPQNCPLHNVYITNETLAERFTENFFPFGLFDGENLIGFVSLTDRGENVFEMNLLSVLPQKRHFGCGKKLIDFCKKEVLRRGGEKIIISIWEKYSRLKDWYAENGFAFIEAKTVDFFPFPVVYMEWRK